MTPIAIPFGKTTIQAELPDGCDVLTMPKISPLKDPAAAIQDALAHPIGTKPLATLAKDTVQAFQGQRRTPTACIVVSDNTRPVPYRGETGILLPLLHTLCKAGFLPQDICVLIATGTHRPMDSAEIEAMLGAEPLAMGVTVLNHNGQDESHLVFLGQTKRGSVIKVNKQYMQADLKILTGLVESHFMAGASGGRKSICPGILGREGTLVFHGPELMRHPHAQDLVLMDNPVHEESLEAARMAGADFIANVTLDRAFQITGIFCGELAAAHEKAVQQLRQEVAIPITQPYDLVVTHGGFVALNHYQAAKCATTALYALKKGGSLIVVANNTDAEPVGAPTYRTALSLLKQMGPQAFSQLLDSDAWPFLFDQWQVQKWAAVLQHLGKEGLTYYAPQPSLRDWDGIPGKNGADFLLPDQTDPATTIPLVIQKSIAACMAAGGHTPADIIAGNYRIAFLQDGPYGIPVKFCV